MLIISLILLMIMTLLGVNAMQSSTMEERMAGNLRDQTLAFQAAESAVRDAETFIEGLASTASFNDSNGLYQADSTLVPDRLDSDDDSTKDHLDGDSTAWSRSKSVAASTIAGTATAPRYYIQHLGTVDGGGSSALNIKGYGALKAGSDVELFRITARGTGGSDSAQVILQSHYGMRF